MSHSVPFLVDGLVLQRDLYQPMLILNFMEVKADKKWKSKHAKQALLTDRRRLIMLIMSLFL